MEPGPFAACLDLQGLYRDIREFADVETSVAKRERPASAGRADVLDFMRAVRSREIAKLEQGNLLGDLGTNTPAQSRR